MESASVLEDNPEVPPLEHVHRLSKSISTSENSTYKSQYSSELTDEGISWNQRKMLAKISQMVLTDDQKKDSDDDDESDDQPFCGFKPGFLKAEQKIEEKPIEIKKREVSSTNNYTYRGEITNIL
jgi:hypothetical protein